MFPTATVVGFFRGMLVGDAGKALWDDSVGRLGKLGCGTLWDIKVHPQRASGGFSIWSPFSSVVFLVSSSKFIFQVNL